MSDLLKFSTAGLMVVLGLSWWVVIEVWRGRSASNHPRMFWLYLTAPLIAIILVLISIWLILETDYIRGVRALAEQRRLESIGRRP